MFDQHNIAERLETWKVDEWQRKQAVEHALISTQHISLYLLAVYVSLLSHPHNAYEQKKCLWDADYVRVGLKQPAAIAGALTHRFTASQQFGQALILFEQKVQVSLFAITDVIFALNHIHNNPSHYDFALTQGSLQAQRQLNTTQSDVNRRRNNNKTQRRSRANRYRNNNNDGNQNNSNTNNTDIIDNRRNNNRNNNREHSRSRRNRGNDRCGNNEPRVVAITIITTAVALTIITTAVAMKM